MSTFSLPDDAVEFLRAGRQFEYDASRVEAGEVKLKRLEELSLGEVWIGTDIDGDQHAGDDGYYAIPAVSLIGECKAYDPDFILLWLPQERLFGTWDCDHWVLRFFAVPVGRTSLRVRRPTSTRSGIGRTRLGRSSCRGRSMSSRAADHFDMSQQPNKRIGCKVPSFPAK